MNVGHIAGPINIEADGLRLSQWDVLPHGFRAFDRFRISLSDLWTQIRVPRCFPSSEAYLLWNLPTSES